MMLELYTLLTSIIDPICPSFADHYPEAKTKVYPYVEIKFPNALPNNTFSDNNLLSINIWHNLGADIRAIEIITDNIHKALNRLQYNDTFMNISINRNAPHRLTLDDPIIHIQRRELRYVVTTYYK